MWVLSEDVCTWVHASAGVDVYAGVTACAQGSRVCAQVPGCCPSKCVLCPRLPLVQQAPVRGCPAARCATVVVSHVCQCPPPQLCVGAHSPAVQAVSIYTCLCVSVWCMQVRGQRDGVPRCAQRWKASASPLPSAGPFVCRYASFVAFLLLWGAAREPTPGPCRVWGPEAWFGAGWRGARQAVASQPGSLCPGLWGMPTWSRTGQERGENKGQAQLSLDWHSCGKLQEEGLDHYSLPHPDPPSSPA